jgi:hypothetical protein
MAQTDCLPHKCKALISNPTSTKTIIIIDLNKKAKPRARRGEGNRKFLNGYFVSACS